MLAYLYNDEGGTRRATQVLSAIPDSARSAKLYSALGYTYEQQKQYKQAIDAYRHAIDLTTTISTPFVGSPDTR